MRKNPVGGRKCKAWRLKKKRNKWHIKLIGDFVTVALAELPREFFKRFFSLQDYGFMRLYK